MTKAKPLPKIAPLAGCKFPLTFRTGRVFTTGEWYVLGEYTGVSSDFFIEAGGPIEKSERAAINAWNAQQTKERSNG